MKLVFSILLAATTPLATVHGVEPPPIPVGLDAYRQWERWPQQRVGARGYMRSTYDRRGNNEGADASHFLYQLADDFNVALDLEGAGLLCFVRTNHWHGSPWHYEVDRKDFIVQETSTADPTKPVPNSVFLPEAPFPNPLTWTWSITKGADLMWVPIGFERSFRLGYSRTRYGTGYYIYQQFVPGIPLSHPIRAWKAEPPPRDVLDLINRAGTDLLPGADSQEGKRMGLKERSGAFDLTVGKGAEFLRVDDKGVVRALIFRVPKDQALAFGRARLRVTWDDRSAPSIDVPLALFFGAGTLYNRDGREYLVKAFPVFIRYTTDQVHLACFFPMPFFRSARFELIGGDTNVPGVRWSVRFAPFEGRPEHFGYLHATYRDHPTPLIGEDLVLLDTRGIEGSDEWSGSFIGTSFIFSHRAFLGTLEGDPRFFFDDSESPQAYGTGTEEWGGGGDYWGGLNMTLPFAGHPVGARKPEEAINDEDKIESAYRFLLSDLFPFGRNARIQLEHGGVNESTEHYETVTYWYGRPSATLVKTDELKIGDATSERAHGYSSPDASEPYEITSRYELGPDGAPAIPHPADAAPLAKPAAYAEFEFDAEPGTYAIWVRGRALEDANTTDASWLQFDSDIGTNRAGSYSHPKAFGNWLDRFPARTWAWSSALPQEPPRTITFEQAARHRLRVQPRHAPHQVSKIWLSTSRKELPPHQTEPKSGPGEIVVRAGEAVSIEGSAKLITDVDTGEKAIEFHGGAPKAQEGYPPHTDHGRKTRGTSEFTLKLDPNNIGVMLRRKLDYQFPNQRAEVFVAEASSSQPTNWQPAGIWYLAGSNTCVYSNPKDELGATEHNVQTSNRRFRQDEFLIPRALTEGRPAIRMRVKFTPVETPLFPGHPLPELAWSEIRYDAYCFIAP
jgi:Protein of unknown function (DUF2961)